MTTILVTGGAGYIGSVCVEGLLSKGYKTIVIDNLSEGHRQASAPDAVFYKGDFGDRVLLDTIFKEHSIEAVIHFAANALVEHSMTDPARYFRNNLVNSITLLDAMRENGCDAMVFSSTAATFGEPAYTPIDEMHPQNPVNAYGETKLMFEKALAWYHRAYRMRYTTFRYFNAAGAGEKFGEDHRPETHLIPIILEVAAGKREKISIFGSDYPTTDGTCVRDYIHVADIADAHILALDRMAEHPAETFNLGNGSGFSNLEVVRTAEKVTGRDIAVEMAPRRAGDPAVLIASSEKARTVLGWKPRYSSLEDIIESAWKWHKNNPNGYS